MRARDAGVGVRADDRARAGAQRGDVPDAQRPAPRCGARDGEFVLDFPAYPRRARRRRDARRASRDALRVQPREVVRARSLFAVLDTPPPCARSTPDFGALAAAADQHRHHRGGRRTRRGPSTSWRATSRPTFGVNEDPVTGSAYCTLAPLLGGAAGQDGAARASGEPPRRRAVVRARRRSRAHRRQGAPRHHGHAHVLRGAMDDVDDFHCSFCGKRRREVRKLISGPRVFICNECVVRSRRDPRPAAATGGRTGGNRRRTTARPAGAGAARTTRT